MVFLCLSHAQLEQSTQATNPCLPVAVPQWSSDILQKMYALFLLPCSYAGIKLPFAATVLEANPRVLQAPESLLHPDKVRLIPLP